MSSSEIYKILSFEKTIDYNKTITTTQNNLIIVIGSAKQHEAQIIYILWFYNINVRYLIFGVHQITK